MQLSGGLDPITHIYIYIHKDCDNQIIIITMNTFYSQAIKHSERNKCHSCKQEDSG
jgi:hypothetical protein